MEIKADKATEALATVVIGAAIEVHRVIGPGLPEKVYREALSHELALRGISHVCEYPVPVVYKGKHVGEGRIDVMVAGRLVVEIKVVEALAPVHKAQALSYLQALKLPLALLLNFNVATMKDGGIRRVLNTYRLPS